MAKWIPATRERAGYYEDDANCLYMIETRLFRVEALIAERIEGIAEQSLTSIAQRLAELEALVAEHIRRETRAPDPMQCTATANQAYTWQPGGWVEQYIEAVGE